MDNTSAFDQLLASLSAETAAPADSMQANKESSASSQRLLHRRRFRMAKQQVFTNNEDLKAVLGHKEAQRESDTKSTVSQALQVNFQLKETSVSTTDYFKQKMEEFKRKISGADVAEKITDERPEKIKRKKSSENDAEEEKKKKRKNRRSDDTGKDQKKESKEERRKRKEEKRRRKEERRIRRETKK